MRSAGWNATAYLCVLLAIELGNGVLRRVQSPALESACVSLDNDRMQSNSELPGACAPGAREQPTRGELHASIGAAREQQSSGGPTS